MPLKVQKIKQENPKAKIEVWFFDEHRVGLKPIIRKIWAKKGERPIAVVEQKYEWLYVYGFLEPKTGKTRFYLIPRVNSTWLNLVMKKFAEEEEAGEEKIIIIVEDNAGWHHSQKRELQLGIKIENLPPYSPELQPAERLWSIRDEPLVNEYFDSIEELEEVLAKRCCYVEDNMIEEIRKLTDYHWLAY